MNTFSGLLMLACAAAAQTGASAQRVTGAYDTVMHAQYSTQQAPTPQRAEEAKRVYELYLSSIGQKTQKGSENSSGEAEGSSH